MTRLKRGDVCPLCGGEIETEDPFTLGYLSALADVLQAQVTAPQDITKTGWKEPERENERDH